MDCGFYIVYLKPNLKDRKKILNFWEEQRKISYSIRESYDREVENKFVFSFLKSISSTIKNK